MTVNSQRNFTPPGILGVWNYKRRYARKEKMYSYTFGIYLIVRRFFVICHDLLAEKPRIIVPSPVIRTVPGHVLWCSSQGSPPINISLLKNSTSLANGIGMAMQTTEEEGLYTCWSSNEAGLDSIEFPVAFVGASLNSHTSNVQMIALS